ncbi:MAG: ThuA domain-containing protein [Alphaproteobacteria bacterium]|nr:ThuA domain-containing protein [Alphaproteobacteria bacterium]
MSEPLPGRAHVIAGGFPPGTMGGHDHDYARLKLLGWLAEAAVPASVANDFADVEKWLATCRLLVTYVAGPYPDAAQTAAIGAWLETGGRWLALHGTNGGRAQRVEGQRMRRTVKSEHHALLGSMFLTHPPIREFRVDVRDAGSPLTRGLPGSFVVDDEPYCVELQDAAATRILLTADYGPSAAAATAGLYDRDTSLLPDGKSRVIAYTKQVGRGGIAYVALGHCHNPAIRAARAYTDPADKTAPLFRAPWENDGFVTLLRNAIAWGTAA